MKLDLDRYNEIMKMRTFRLMVFIISIWATIILTRLITFFIPTFFFELAGNHVHHYAYGILVMIISGTSLIFLDGVYKDLGIPFFGAGVGMVVDEYAFVIAGDEIGYSSKLTIMTIIALSGVIVFLARYFQKFSDVKGKEETIE